MGQTVNLLPSASVVRDVYKRQAEDCEVAVYSTERRCLVFHTALLAPKTTRTTQGVAVMRCV